MPRPRGLDGRDVTTAQREKVLSLTVSPEWDPSRGQTLLWALGAQVASGPQLFDLPQGDAIVGLARERALKGVPRCLSITQLK